MIHDPSARTTQAIAAFEQLAQPLEAMAKARRPWWHRSCGAAKAVKLPIFKASSPSNVRGGDEPIPEAPVLLGSASGPDDPGRHTQLDGCWMCRRQLLTKPRPLAHADD
jgi:hypothetical protein